MIMSTLKRRKLQSPKQHFWLLSYVIRVACRMRVNTTFHDRDNQSTQQPQPDLRRRRSPPPGMEEEKEEKGEKEEEEEEKGREEVGKPPGALLPATRWLGG